MSRHRDHGGGVANHNHSLELLSTYGRYLREHSRLTRLPNETRTG